VTIGRRADLLRDEVALHHVVLHDRADGEVEAQVRAHGEPVAARFDGDTVRFVSPQPRVAPGQVVVLYDRDVVIGGGIAG
jgi:tRNA U34 2-thiouridine synthase MnmA/TrmU